MGHRAIYRCKQPCIMANKCTVKAWNEDKPREVCLYSDEWTPIWERFEAKTGQKRLY